MIEQNKIDEQSNVLLTLSGLVKLIQTIFNFDALWNPFVTTIGHTSSVASQVSGGSTIKTVAADLAHLVNIKDFILIVVKQWKRSKVQELYMFEYFVEMEPLIGRFYLLHCSKKKVTFFCRCLFNIVLGHPASAEIAAGKKLEMHRKLIEILCNKMMGVIRKEHFLSASHGLKLLTSLQPSVSHHIKSFHCL